LNATYTSLPLSLSAMIGLSVQETLPKVLTGAAQWAPWSTDFVNMTLKPFMYSA
jgi:hypothetical protein